MDAQHAQDTDIVLASVILHDIQKCGIPWQKHTNYEHGKIASNWLRQFSLKEPEKTKIIEAVRYHMSRFTGTREDIPRACSPTQIELIVQLTDFFSSRKYASWLPNHNTSQEQIDNFLPGIIEQQSLNMQKEK